jgi:hypothetical protein
LEMHPCSEAGAKVSVIRDGRAALRQMTSEQLLHLGMNRIAYLKFGMCDGNTLFMVYGADGIPIAVMGDVDAAVEAAAEHGLSFIAVH